MSIHALPNELLLQVFSYIPVPVGRGRLDTRLPPGATWLSIGHVCRRWRTLFNGCPAFWSTIIFEPECWTRTSLERARNAPLTVALPYQSRSLATDKLIQEALHHISRTQKLDLFSLTLSENARKTFVPILQSSSADILEELSIGSVHDGFLDSGEAIVIPDDIFCGRAPKLAKLVLLGRLLQFNWTNHLFSCRLKFLHISDINMKNKPTIAQLISVLESIRTSLETLILSDVLCLSLEESHKSPTHEQHRQVHFPALKTFRMRDSVLGVEWLLDRISAPPDVSSEIYVGEERENTIVLSTSLQAFKCILSKWSDMQVDDTTTVDLSVSYGASHSSWRLNRIPDGQDRGPTLNEFNTPYFRFIFRNPGSDTPYIVGSTLTPSFPLSIVRALQIHASVQFPLAGYTFVASLSSLEYLTAKSHALYGVLNALSDAGPRACPRLREITLLGYPYLDLGEIIETLEEVLKARLRSDDDDISERTPNVALDGHLQSESTPPHTVPAEPQASSSQVFDNSDLLSQGMLAGKRARIKLRLDRCRATDAQLARLNQLCEEPVDVSE